MNRNIYQFLVALLSGIAFGFGLSLSGMLLLLLLLLSVYGCFLQSSTRSLSI